MVETSYLRVTSLVLGSSAFFFLKGFQAKQASAIGMNATKSSYEYKEKIDAYLRIKTKSFKDGNLQIPQIPDLKTENIRLLARMTCKN